MALVWSSIGYLSPGRCFICPLQLISLNKDPSWTHRGYIEIMEKENGSYHTRIGHILGLRAVTAVDRESFT